jgi:hypothetical protein
MRRSAFASSCIHTVACSQRLVFLPPNPALFLHNNTSRFLFFITWSHLLASNRAGRFSKDLGILKSVLLRLLLTPQTLLQHNNNIQDQPISAIKHIHRKSWIETTTVRPNPTQTLHGNNPQSQSLAWKLPRKTPTTTRLSHHTSPPTATQSCPTKTRPHQQQAPATASQPPPSTPTTESNTTATSRKRPSPPTSRAPLQRVQSAA